MLRYIMECPCLHNKLYNKTDEEKAQDAIEREGKRLLCSWDCFEATLEYFGGFTALIFVVISFGYLAYGGILAYENGPNFYQSWLLSQAFSYFGTSPATLMMQFIKGYYYDDQPRIFKKRWAHLFPGDTPPISYSDLAAYTIIQHGEPMAPYFNWRFYFKLPLTNEDRKVKLNTQDHIYLDTV